MRVQLQAQEGEAQHLREERDAVAAGFADLKALLERSLAERKAGSLPPPPPQPAPGSDTSPNQEMPACALDAF